MRCVRRSAESRTFALGSRERDFLLAVLRAYPVVPESHQPLSRHSAVGLDAEDEHLLAEALAEQRSGNRSRVERWLSEGRLKQAGNEWEFDLKADEFDWMLQVLNDVRVGYWIRLGCPDDVAQPMELLKRDPSSFFFMEAAGLFQMELLQGFSGEGS